jgi:putative zinc finger/helix-turn-helix YgiT family protein
MKTKTRPRRRAVVLPDDACLTCGTMMRRTQEALTSSVNGEEIRVPKISHLRCPKCGEGLFSLQEAEALRLGAFDIYRKKYGLLSADEIRAVREQHGLTQAELAQLLRLGGNTLSRWEAGRNVQSAAMDVLLRLIRDLPGSLEYLREHAA